MISLRKKLRDLQVRPQKRLGQHFVTSPHVLRKILECAALEAEDVILEIGAGLGSLTAPLAQKVRKVYAIEVDPRLVEALRGQFAKNDQVKIILADALQVDFASLAQEGEGKMKVVANLPYEISSPMIFRLFQERNHFSLFVLMLQMEVARRIVARQGTKDYGPLSVWSRLYSRPKIVFSIPPQAFYPQPKVESAVVKFEILPHPSLEVDNEEILHRVIRSAFTYRRKTITNALRLGGFPRLPPKKIQNALESAGINPSLRGEALSLEQFRDLGRALMAEG